MNFSRFQISLLVAIGLIISSSSALALVFNKQRVEADRKLRDTFLTFSSKLPRQDQGSLPVIQDINWTPFEEQLEQVKGKKITLTWEDKIFSPQDKDLESFISHSIDGGEATADLSSGAIDKYIAKLAKSVDVKEKPRKITDEGEVVDEGQKGRRLNRDHLKNALVQALLTKGDQKSITLQVEEIDLGEKIVAKPFTPGLYEGKYIEINLATQTMYVFEGNNLVKHYIISTGKWNMPTPEGTFTINNKVSVAYSKRYKLYMPNWMSFVGSSYGIHGLPYRGNWIEGESHLGTPVSHGCVRLAWDNANELYDWAEIGTVVYSHK